MQTTIVMSPAKLAARCATEKNQGRRAGLREAAERLAGRLDVPVDEARALILGADPSQVLDR